MTMGHRGADGLGDVAARAHAALSRLASTLYGIDDDADVTFVRGQAKASPLAARLVADLDEVWQQYPSAKDTLDAADDALRRGDQASARRLLGPGALGTPDGRRVDVLVLLGELQSVADAASAEIHQLAARARAALASVDGATRTLAAVTAQAEGVDAVDDPPVAAARAAVEAATARIAADPAAAPPPASLDEVVEAARAHVAALVAARASLPDDLAAAHAEVDEIRSLAQEGIGALAATREKILAPAGLLQPIDPGSLADGDEALAPWLQRIDKEAANGGWRSASAALRHWHRVADAWRDNARRILDANRAPLDRRNELRGLLDGFAAKAAAGGRAEEPALLDLRQKARDLLYVAPCDLDAAERAVAAYASAVNAPGAKGPG